MTRQIGYVQTLRCMVLQRRCMLMPRYRTIRLREEDFKKMKDVQKLLRKKGTDSIDWKELRGKQDLVDLPDEDEEGSEDLRVEEVPIRRALLSQPHQSSNLQRVVRATRVGRCAELAGSAFESTLESADRARSSVP